MPSRISDLDMRSTNETCTLQRIVCAPVLIVHGQRFGNHVVGFHTCTTQAQRQTFNAGTVGTRYDGRYDALRTSEVAALTDSIIAVHYLSMTKERAYPTAAACPSGVSTRSCRRIHRSPSLHASSGGVPSPAVEKRGPS